MDLTQRGILSRHCFFQTSWTGDKRCQHVKGMSSRRSTPSTSEYMKFSYPIKLSESRPPSSRSNSTVRTVFNCIPNGQQVSGQTKGDTSEYKWVSLVCFSAILKPLLNSSLKTLKIDIEIIKIHNSRSTIYDYDQFVITSIHNNVD